MPKSVNDKNYECHIHTKSLEDTYQLLKPLLKKIGVTRVANIAGLDTIGIPVVSCIRPLSKNITVSQGKGLIELQATVSAIMETLEAYHMENPPESCLTGSYEELASRFSLINLGVYLSPGYSEKRINQLPLEWVAAQNILNNQPIYVPSALTSLDISQPNVQYAYFNVSTNGIAAGADFSAALSHAILEIIERDALFQWQHTESPLENEIDLSIFSEAIISLIERFTQCNVNVRAWDITSKFGIPCFQVAILNDDPFRTLPLFTGTACHPHYETAFIKALLEAAQSRLTLIAGIRDDIFPEHYKYVQALSASLDENKNKLISKVRSNTSFQQNTLDWLLTQLTSNGISDIIVVDHTKKEIGIPVAQCFIPQLQFSSSRFSE